MMNEKEFTNAIREIGRSERIGIILPENPTTDAIGAGLALYLFLAKYKKEARVIAPKFFLPQNHKFLPESNVITGSLEGAHEYVIQVDVSKTKVDTLSYDVIGDVLNIRLKPKDGTFREQDVRHKGAAYAFDLLIALDATSLESLGSLFEEHASLFYETPIIVIGHDPENEHFGQINLVDMAATSVSEIVYELLAQWDKNKLDEHIATNLLSGIITKTKIFRSPQVTPRSLAIASLLVEQGARRAEIVQHLYQTKTIPMLQLWGRALARLQSTPDGWYVWTKLSAGDFTKTESREDHISGVIDELMINTPKAKVIAVMYESDNGIRGVVASHKQIDGMDLLAPFEPRGTGDLMRIRFSERTLDEAEAALKARVEAELVTLFRNQA